MILRGSTGFKAVPTAGSRSLLPESEGDVGTTDFWYHRAERERKAK
jgi:hypothetical protein